ncbi:MAG: HAD-IC family P-type ATPase, partial [Bacteroidaceae bacterium]|nr:HAD-IC family P-type ATPase [Bacteroidaceae bacterium]
MTFNDIFTDSDPQVLEGKGKNIIPPPKRKPLWVAYLEKFSDPIIIVLLMVFAFSLGVSFYEISEGGSLSLLFEPIGVLVALLLATGVGFIFEVKAASEFEVLNKVKDSRLVKVLRKSSDDNSIYINEIKKSDVVLGDVIKLESGDEIPADGYLLESFSFRVDESNFTGENYAKKSAVEAEFDAEATYPSNFLLRGTTVIEGRALFRVSAVGMDTQEGLGVAKIQEGSEVKTPLNLQLEQLGSWLSKAAFAIGCLIIIGRLLYFYLWDGDAANNANFLETIQFVLNSIMIAVTIIVVAVPEGLPMSITVSLALSMRKMLKENNLVRKLHACETMGAATVICTDKTGTLTQNRMT